MTEQGPSQPPRMSRRTFLTGLVGLGAAIGFPGCAPQSPDSKPTIPTTTIRDSVPDTTAGTTIPTTEAPTTTIDERVFTSPEQKAQVEKVEENMANFYKLTPKDLREYTRIATFNPYPHGFSTVSQEGSTRVVLAINLGVMPVGFGAEGTGNLQFFGSLDLNGNSFVTCALASIPDSEYTARYPAWQFDQKLGVNIWKPIAEPNVYGTDINNQSLGGNPQQLLGLQAVQYLESTIGQPVAIQAGDFDTDAGMGIVPNRTLISIMKDIHSAARKGGDNLSNTLSQYTDEQLATLGVFKNPGSDNRVILPQSIIDGFPGGYKQAFESLSVAMTNSMYTNAPALI